MTTARSYQRRVCHARGARANVRASVAFDQLIADVYDLAVFLGKITTRDKDKKADFEP